MDTDELPAWLRLMETPLVGRESARRLLAAFGSPEAVFGADRTARSAVVGERLAVALETAPETFGALLAETRSWLDAGNAASPRGLLALGDADYPPQLLHTADPPLLLYLQGRRELLASDMLAIIAPSGSSLRARGGLAAPDCGAGRMSLIAPAKGFSRNGFG